ncbi:hypothetical protein KQ941_13950 [Paenibacillus xylanexedens]|uniref:hypothetical protein n=1 Tax=Paenibacillus xylanexedens TaxID=528191 RepID=UPI001F43C1C5|nr:hypothetical protein [Paenibacillus xylanexedens]MCF7755551.1 hypothetical protein [Paenibacillus xylanexedens]
MATVGDQLLNPESGWQRVDDANKSIKYNGNWLSVTGDPNTYAGTAHYFTLSGATTNSIEFYFYGTKLRIIDMYWSNRVNNVTVELDGVISSYNPNNSTNKYRVIVFERLNLQYGFHKVKLTTTSTSNNFSLDAIDIDSNGEIVSGLNKFLISSGDEYVSFSPKVRTGEYIIPIMTSNVDSASGITLTGDPKTSTTWHAWGAFDRKTASGSGLAWVSETSALEAGWIVMHMPSNKKVPFSYVIQGFLAGMSDINYAPKDWNFYGSHDGVEWKVLDSQRGVTDWVSGVYKEYPLSTNESHDYYKIEVTANPNGRKSLGDFNIIASIPMSYDVINKNSLNENDYINHGLNKNYEIDMNSQIRVWKGIALNSIVLGSGKVFKQKIDTTKIPIKKASVT